MLLAGDMLPSEKRRAMFVVWALSAFGHRKTGASFQQLTRLLGYADSMVRKCVRNARLLGWVEVEHEGGKSAKASIRLTDAGAALGRAVGVGSDTQAAR